MLYETRGTKSPDEPLAIALRERAAFMDERNQTRKELEALRERHNQLAVHCDKLEKDSSRLRDNGRIESYVQTLRALTQLAVDLGIPDAESTGHDTLVFQLREKFAALSANQEAADVLRLIEGHEVSVRPMAGLWNGECLSTRWRASSHSRTIAAATSDTVAEAVKLLIDLSDRKPGITLPAKDEQPAQVSPSDNGTEGGEQEAQDPAKRYGREIIDECCRQLREVLGIKCADGDGNNSVHWLIGECSRRLDEANREIERLRRALIGSWVEYDNSPYQLATDEHDALTAGVVQQDCGTYGPKVYRMGKADIDSIAKRVDPYVVSASELSELCKCREAWDAVRKHAMYIQSTLQPEWRAGSWGSRSVSAYHADPIDAVLALAKTLEAGR